MREEIKYIVVAGYKTYFDTEEEARAKAKSLLENFGIGTKVQKLITRENFGITNCITLDI